MVRANQFKKFAICRTEKAQISACSGMYATSRGIVLPAKSTQVF